MNKMINSTITSMLLLCLGGCSNGPSESDAKAIIQKSIGNCEYFSIDHFERVNGTPQGAGHYQVDIKYSVKMKPTPDIRAYASEKYAEEIGRLKQELSYAHEVDNAWKSDQQVWLQANPGSTTSAYEVAHEDGWAKYQKVMPLLLSENELMTNAPRTAKAAMARAMRQTCPYVDSTLLNNFFNGNDLVEQYANEIKKTFTGKVFMVKTDNGWQEGR
ncbi:hypothetical protein KIV45_27070 [Janthinobacterium lividum]|nr:hypothetical protein KIV45_27070 [Janthinobacterium lividum]